MWLVSVAGHEYGGSDDEEKKVAARPRESSAGGSLRDCCSEEASSRERAVEEAENLQAARRMYGGVENLLGSKIGKRKNERASVGKKVSSFGTLLFIDLIVSLIFGKLGESSHLMSEPPEIQSHQEARWSISIAEPKRAPEKPSEPPLPFTPA